MVKGTADAFSLAHRFVVQQHPDAEAAVLAGSDYDVVLLFHSLPDGAWQEMTMFEGQDIEVFAHDLRTLAQFCRDIDGPSGVAALPVMVAERVAIWSSVSGTLDAARKISRETRCG